MERIHFTGGDRFFVELQIVILEKSFKQSNMATCQERNNQWTNEVYIRVFRSIGNLHVADDGYYADSVS